MNKYLLEDNDVKYKFNEKISVNYDEDCVVMVNSNTNKIYYGGDIEREILIKVENGESIQSIINKFNEKYNSDMIDRDINDFILNLVKLGILVAI